MILTLIKKLLEAQLLNFKANFQGSNQNITLTDIIDSMIKPGYRELLSEISIVLELILILPATNSESERGFSTLKRIKPYLRNTMGEERLNSLMLLNIYQEETKNLSLEDVANEFAFKNDRRTNDFGVKKF